MDNENNLQDFVKNLFREKEMVIKLANEVLHLAKLGKSSTIPSREIYDRIIQLAEKSIKSDTVCQEMSHALYLKFWSQLNEWVQREFKNKITLVEVSSFGYVANGMKNKTAFINASSSRNLSLQEVPQAGFSSSTRTSISIPDVRKQFNLPDDLVITPIFERVNEATSAEVVNQAQEDGHNPLVDFISNFSYDFEYGDETEENNQEANNVEAMIPEKDAFLIPSSTNDEEVLIVGTNEGENNRPAADEDLWSNVVEEDMLQNILFDAADVENILCQTEFENETL